MGQMKRAEERERLLRSKLRITHDIIITWRTDDGYLLVNFLHAETRLPLTHQRIYKNPDTIVSLVDRSLNPLRAGPRAVMLANALRSGKGQIQIQISGEQYVKLQASRTPQ